MLAHTCSKHELMSHWRSYPRKSGRQNSKASSTIQSRTPNMVLQSSFHGEKLQTSKTSKFGVQVRPRLCARNSAFVCSGVKHAKAGNTFLIRTSLSAL